MTDDQINAKFDTVAGHLATLAVGLQQLQKSQARTEQTVNRLADKVDRTAGSITNLLAVAEIQAGEIKDLTDSLRAVDKRERETRENLNALINTVERFISERRNGK